MKPSDGSNRSNLKDMTWHVSEWQEFPKLSLHFVGKGGLTSRYTYILYVYILTYTKIVCIYIYILYIQKISNYSDVWICMVYLPTKIFSSFVLEVKVTLHTPAPLECLGIIFSMIEAWDQVGCCSGGHGKDRNPCHLGHLEENNMKITQLGDLLTIAINHLSQLKHVGQIWSCPQGSGVKTPTLLGGSSQVSDSLLLMAEIQHQLIGSLSHYF